jgi:hypothetical protein
MREVPFDSGAWETHAGESRVEDHLGRRSLYLKGGIATIATADGESFADGALAVDVAFSGERGFMGAIWRVADTGNYEELYVRPHQSGNPDATQYTPVYNGVSGWQLYHGERYAVATIVSSAASAISMRSTCRWSGARTSSCWRSRKTTAAAGACRPDSPIPQGSLSRIELIRIEQ